MNPFASLVGVVAMAAPLDAPPPPELIVVPPGYVVRDGGKGNLVLEPMTQEIPVRIIQPQVIPFRPQVIPWDQCRT